MEREGGHEMVRERGEYMRWRERERGEKMRWRQRGRT